MNYVSHLISAEYLDNPYAFLGTILPDLFSAIGKISHLDKISPKIDSMLGKGFRLHLEMDKEYLYVKNKLVELDLEEDEFYLIQNIIVEICGDSVIMDQESKRVGEIIERVKGLLLKKDGQVESFLRTVCTTSRSIQTLYKTAQKVFGYIEGYKTPEGIIDAGNRLYQRMKFDKEILKTEENILKIKKIKRILEPDYLNYIYDTSKKIQKRLPFLKKGH